MTTPQQLTAAHLATMSHQAIEAARVAGQLDRILGVPDAQIALTARGKTGRIDMVDVQALAAINRHDLIETARAEDRIDYPDTTGA